MSLQKVLKPLSIALILCVLPFTLLTPNQSLSLHIVSSVLCMMAVMLIIFRDNKRPLLNAHFTLAGDVLLAGSFCLVAFMDTCFDKCIFVLIVALPVVDFFCRLQARRTNAPKPERVQSRHSLLPYVEFTIVIAVLCAVAFVGCEGDGGRQWGYFAIGGALMIAGCYWMLFGLNEKSRYRSEGQLNIVYVSFSISSVSWLSMREATTGQVVWSWVLALLTLTLLIIDVYRYQDKPMKEMQPLSEGSMGTRY